MSEREKLLAVKAAADMVVAIIGAQGKIDSRHPAVARLLRAIGGAEGEPVKYGCYADADSLVDGQLHFDCLEEECSQVRDGRFSGSHDCKHWKPIK